MHALPPKRRSLAFPLLFLALASIFGLLFATASNITSHALRAPVSVSQSHAKTADRPVWDGKGSYPDDGVMPLCEAASVNHVAESGHGFVVRCVSDGMAYVWNYVTTSHIWHVWHVHHLLHLRYIHAQLALHYCCVHCASCLRAVRTSICRLAVMYYQIDGDTEKFLDNLRGLTWVIRDAMDMARDIASGEIVIRKYNDDGSLAGWTRKIPKQPSRERGDGWHDAKEGMK